MYIYRIGVGDNQGSDNVDTLHIKANNFDIAYQKATAILKKRTVDAHKDTEKESPENRIEKSYAFTIESIERSISIDG